MLKKKQEKIYYDAPDIKVVELENEGVLCASPDHGDSQLPDLGDGGDILAI